MTTDHTTKITEILNDPDLTDAERISRIRDLSRPTMEGVAWDPEEHYLQEAEYRSHSTPIYVAMLARVEGTEAELILCSLPGGAPFSVSSNLLRPTGRKYNLTPPEGGDTTCNTDETAPGVPANGTTDRSGTSALFETDKPSRGTARPKKYLTIPEAAELCGRSRGYLENLAKDGYLHATDVADLPKDARPSRAATRYTTEEDLIAAGFLDHEGRKGVSMTEAAEILGMSRSKIKRKVDSGEFRSIRTKDPKAVSYVVLGALPSAE